jgi:hypothetical protein
MVKNRGVDPVLAAVSAGYETLVFMATGAALALAYSPFALSETFWNRFPASWAAIKDYRVLWPLFVMGATFATTPFSAWLFTKICRKTVPSEPPQAVCQELPLHEPKEPGATLNRQVPQEIIDSLSLPAITAGLICRGVAVNALGWACHALSLGFVLQSISKQPIDWTQFPLWLASTSLSTVAGFVVLIAPGGVGVREGLLIETLKDQPQIGPQMALIAAALLRAVWFLTELIAASVLLLANKRSRHT